MTTRYGRPANVEFYREVSKFSLEATALNSLAPNALQQEFQDALSKKMQDVQFFPRGRDECYVYYPHEKYARGKISTAPATQYEDRRLAVTSRTITNERYGSSNPEHRMQWSKNFDTAVKKAAAALTAWGVEELAAVHSHGYGRSRNDQIDEVNRKMRETLSNLGVGSQMTPAFVTLKNMLHQITDLDVKSKVSDITRYLQEETELRSGGSAPTFVYVGQDRHGDRHLDALRLKEIMYSTVVTEENPIRHYDRSPDINKRENYDYLVGKINVLSMASEGEYITGVGMKAAEDMFYVC